MADLRTSSDIRKIPDFKLLWFWCLLLLFSSPCVSAHCFGVNLTVSIYPTSLMINYGQPLEIFCLVDSNYSADDIQFIQYSNHGSVIESEIVNDTTRRLYIEKPEKQVTTYYCRNNRSNKICTARVIVDSPPKDVTDFECLSNNFETLNCSWTRPESFVVVYRKLGFSSNGYIAGPLCIPEGRSTQFCTWNVTSVPRYRVMNTEQNFHMTACNAFGCNDQNFTMEHYSIVKPNAPENLRVVKKDTHSVTLRWQIPNNILDFLECGVDHIIEYQSAEEANRTNFVTVDTSNLPARNRTYLFTLTDLPYANMQYEVRIYIKSKKATSRKYVSKFKYVVFRTSSDIPIKPPNVITGAFDQYTRNNERVINVYWQKIKDIENAGPSFTYKVLVSQSNNIQTIYPDKDTSHISFNATLAALDVTIWSHNINGSSLNSSHIYIPSERDTQNLKIINFTKMSFDNGTYELSWDGVNNIDNYTLFWCKQNANEICTGEIDFDVLDPTKSTLVIDLPIEYRYRFAISANSGVNSSGMTWAKLKLCDTLHSY